MAIYFWTFTNVEVWTNFHPKSESFRRKKMQKISGCAAAPTASPPLSTPARKPSHRCDRMWNETRLWPSKRFLCLCPSLFSQSLLHILLQQVLKIKFKKKKTISRKTKQGVFSSRLHSFIYFPLLQTSKPNLSLTALLQVFIKRTTEGKWTVSQTSMQSWSTTKNAIIKPVQTRWRETSFSISQCKTDKDSGSQIHV